MWSVGRNLLEPEKSIDNEPPYAAPTHGLENPISERVEDVLGRWVPEDFQMTLFKEVVQLNPDACRLQPQA
jgi:hypothetical protein